MQTVQNEIWKGIKGYESYYQISNLGGVRSLDKKVLCTHKKTRTHKGKLLSLNVHPITGYIAIGLWNNNKFKMFRVHRLVAESFIPNPENKRTVNHKNGIKTDNRAENLEWMTYSENHSHSYKYLGRIAGMTGILNEENKRSIPVIRIDKNNNLVIYASATDAQRKTGIQRSNINKVLNKKLKTAGGYKWIYKNG